MIFQPVKNCLNRKVEFENAGISRQIYLWYYLLSLKVVSQNNSLATRETEGMEFYPFLYPPRDRSINVSKKKKKKKKKRNKADNSFPINVTRPPFICPFDLLIVCTSRSFQFWSRSGHDHSLAFPTVHEIDIVVLRRFKFTRTVFPSTIPLSNLSSLARSLVIRSAFIGIDCVYRFRYLSWSPSDKGKMEIR